MRSMSARIAIAIVLSACAAPQRPTATGNAPAWFVGAWKREWIQPRGAAPVEKRIVRDLQTPAAFGSVRIPLDRPALAAARSFDDLDDTQLAALLQQNGFAGTASFDGLVATWRHDIDFQPPGEPDVGRLERVGPGRVREHAMDESYVELWWSMSSGDGRYLAVKVMRGQRVERQLVVVGDHFIYARNRSKDLPPADSLADLAAKTHATRAQIVELLDCELSYGLVRGGRVPWEVRHSTLPWNEGRALAFAGEVALDAAGEPTARTPVPGETWLVAVDTIRSDLPALFSR
jgi:hypothetical protein